MNLRITVIGEAITPHISAQFFSWKSQVMLYIDYLYSELTWDYQLCGGVLVLTTFSARNRRGRSLG